MNTLRNIGTKWYQCPKGHAYTIGECGLAMIESICPECGEKIGGKDHKLLKTNKMVDFDIDVKNNIDITPIKVINKKDNQNKESKNINEIKDKNENMNNKFCRSIHEFSYIVSNGSVIKESSSNNQAEINFKNNKCSISSDKINKIKKFDKNIGIKKINSVNEINIKNNIKKDSKDFNNKEKTNSNEDESDDDSGDSLGLGNNSD